MRPDGVRGLFAAVFGENELEEAPLEKLLHVAQILGAVPSVVAAEVWPQYQPECVVSPGRRNTSALSSRVWLSYSPPGLRPPRLTFALRHSHCRA